MIEQGRSRCTPDTVGHEFLEKIMWLGLDGTGEAGGGEIAVLLGHGMEKIFQILPCERWNFPATTGKNGKPFICDIHRLHDFVSPREPFPGS